MATKFNATHFIRKFKDIPDSQWTTGMFTRKERHCALGLLGAPTKNHREVMALIHLFKKYLQVKPAQINDGDDTRFKNFKTPKGRIIKALRIIKAIRQAE